MQSVLVNIKASLPALFGVEEVLLSDWGRHLQWAVWSDVSAGDTFSFSILRHCTGRGCVQDFGNTNPVSPPPWFIL